MARSCARLVTGNRLSGCSRPGCRATGDHFPRRGIRLLSRPVLGWLGLGPWYPPPFYGGWWAYPSSYPFYGPPLYWAPQPNLGEVKLQSAAKDAEVYLDNAYAGTSSKLKSFCLRPGVYELEVRTQGRAPQAKRIYVLTGKTLKVNME